MSGQLVNCGLKLQLTVRPSPAIRSGVDHAIHSVTTAIGPTLDRYGWIVRHILRRSWSAHEELLQSLEWLPL